MMYSLCAFSLRRILPERRELTSSAWYGENIFDSGSGEMVNESSLMKVDELFKHFR